MSVLADKNKYNPKSFIYQDVIGKYGYTFKGYFYYYIVIQLFHNQKFQLGIVHKSFKM